VERLSDRLVEWQMTLPDGPVDPSAGQVHYGWPEASTGARR
jgi:hypothetical protein